MRLPIYVIGLGRCGTSAMMGMLSAAGVPLWTDEYTAPLRYETLATRDEPSTWLDDVGERAVKAVWPWARNMPDDVDRRRMIVMTRDPNDQADSQITGERERYGRRPAGERRAALERYYQDAGAQLMQTYAGALFIRFARLIQDPIWHAYMLCDRFDLDRSKAAAMAGTIWKRPARHCGVMLDNWGD